MKYIICDIDGTIADCRHRLHHIQVRDGLQPLDWDAFYESCDKDTPIKDVIKIIEELSQSQGIIFCTGRRESVRKKTEEWLRKHFEFPAKYSFDLLMRPNGDRRHDTEVKPELLKNTGLEQSDIAFIIEDRKSMVLKWRELGFTCFQVAEGDF